MNQIAINLRPQHIEHRREDVELENQTLSLLADIAEPISIDPGEFAVIPTSIVAVSDGSVVGLMEIHAGRHVEDHEDATFGGYFAPPPGEETVVLATVANHTGATVIVRPATSIGVMSFRVIPPADDEAESDSRAEIAIAAANEDGAEEGVAAVYAPQHIDGETRPGYATTGSAAIDLRADLEKTVVLKPGERMLVPTGLRVAIPEGYEGQVRPRSGLALKHGITIANAPGTVDSDYRGDVGVILMNAGSEDFPVEPGDRVAQMLFAPVTRLALDFRNDLSETDRGAGGFGSTGKR